MSNVGFNNYYDHATDFVLGNHCLANVSSVATPGMAIKAGSSAIMKFANTVNYCISGKWYQKTTADVTLPTTYVNNTGTSVTTGLALPIGTTVAAVIPTGYKAFVAAYLDASGNVTSAITTPVLATSTDAILLPSYADTKVCIGGVLISNASGSDFTCATTALDLTGVTTTYVNLGKAFPLMAVA